MTVIWKIWFELLTVLMVIHLLMSHSKKFGSLWREFLCSPRACVGFLSTQTQTGCLFGSLNKQVGWVS